MDVLRRIATALKDDRENPILRFDVYTIEKRIGGGEQGLVLAVKNEAGYPFALKLSRPAPQYALKDFKREMGILHSMRHSNIVKLWTGGTATWDEQEQKWQRNEALDQELDEGAFFYLVMELVEGQEISSLFAELSELGETGEQPAPVCDKLMLFERLAAQVADAIGYYHSKGIYHKDIKPKNVLYCVEDSRFVIVDFGYARHHDSPQDEVWIRRPDIFDAVSIQALDYKRNDLAQFAKILKRILPSLEDEYDRNRYDGLRSAIEKAIDPDINRRYASVLQFYDAFRQYFLVSPVWRLNVKLGEHLAAGRFGRFNRKMRIPVSGSVLLTEEVCRIVDSPEFQRLRGVRQLGPIIFVFPGANHTRFEHSLGTYFLSLRYLDELTKLHAFRSLCYPMDEATKLIVLAALLHDIGHYPYSHWIEEMDEFPEFPKHETERET